MAGLIETPHVRSRSPKGRGRDSVLTDVVVGTIVVAALAIGKELFVPIAIAVLLSFVLEPLQRLLRKTGLGRVASVLTVVTIVFVTILGFGATFVREAGELASELPQYQATITRKVESLRSFTSDTAAIRQASSALRNLGVALSGRTESQPADSPAPTQAGQQQPVQVEIRPSTPTPFDLLQGAALGVLGPLATAGIVAVFTVLILLQREDLRDRIIRLAGTSDLQRATTAIDDTAHRLSRYFLSQLLVNLAFGTIIGVGLTIIGLPSATLWGILAMILRFVPYLGASMAGILPAALAAAIDPGWTMAFLTVGLFLIVDTIIGQVIEPLLYGRSTGLSPIAIVVSASFWTWLWGPIGLLLSTPLTVCLSVLGQHVERLGFLDIILGTTPPLTPSESFYQRMLAGHPAEAAEEAEALLKTRPLAAYYDEIAVGGLMLALGDFQRGRLEEAQQARIHDSVEDMLEDIEDHKDSAQRIAASRNQAGDDNHDGKHAETPLNRVVCIGGRGPLDDAAAALLAHLLRAAGISARAEAYQPPRRDKVASFDPAGAQLVCLSYLGDDMSVAQIRYEVRRLRRRLPGSTFMVGIWSAELDAAKLEEMRVATHADLCAGNLTQAVQLGLEFFDAGQSDDHDLIAEASVA